MKSVSSLSLFVLGALSVFVIGSAQGSQHKHSEKHEVDLDKEIFKYQIDALMCAASPIVARIPGSSEALEASKCALVAGLGATEIVRSLTECTHLRHTQNNRDLLGCLKSGSSYFATNKEALACLLGHSLDKGAKKILHHLGVVGDIVTCSLTVAQGATLLVDTTRAANKARQDARASADTLAKMVSSLKGSRLYNMGFYRGCLGVTQVYPDDEHQCIRLCRNQKSHGMGELGGSLNSQQKFLAFEACQAGCNATEAVPNSWIYTVLVSSESGRTRKGCELVVKKVRETQEGAAQVNFRSLLLPGVNSGTKEEREGAFLAWRIRLASALDALARKWITLHRTNGFVRTEDIVAMSYGDDDDAKLISSVFGNKDLGVHQMAIPGVEYPLISAYLDSTQTGSVDGFVHLSDLKAFKDEVARYQYGE